MNWRDAYEQRITAWKFWNSPLAETYTRGFVHDNLKKGRDGEANFYRGLPGMQAASLAWSEPIYVDDDMVDLIEAAAAEFEPEDFVADDVLVPAGFALLARPLTLNDANGRLISVRAILWAPTTHNKRADDVEPEGLLISYYSHMDDPDAYGFRELMESMPDPDENPFLRYPLTLQHMTTIDFGESFPTNVTAVEHGGKRVGAPASAVRDSYRQLWTLTQVTMRLMVQKISTVEPRRVDRAARKRAVRANVGDTDAVTVVTLRRLREAGEATGASHQYTHRWIVHGHWRNQWYPSRKRHRRIWINPYVKGPEDAELRIKPRAFQLTR